MSEARADSCAVSVVPLLICEDEAAFAKTAKKAGAPDLAESLASALDGEVVHYGRIARSLKSLDDLADLECLTKPCVFLLMFDEHAPMRLLMDVAVRLCHSHVASLPVYCYLHSVGSVPFKIKLEEIHGLNYGRPFHSICLSENWQVTLPEVVSQIASLVSEANPILAGMLPAAQRNVFAPNANLFRLPYLRMFREDYSVAVFYAGLEYALMLAHAFAAIHASLFAPDACVGAAGPFHVTKTSFTDAHTLQYLSASVRELGQRSPFARLLGAEMSEAAYSGLRSLFDDLDVEAQPSGRTWLSLLEAYLPLRNATKGHGVTYFVDSESIHHAIGGLVELTSRLSDLPLRIHTPGNPETTRLDKTFYVNYTRLGTHDKSFMANPDSHLHLAGENGSLPLFPNVLYHPSYDFFLYAGAAKDGLEWYYKNYATGMYVALDPATLREPEG